MIPFWSLDDNLKDVESEEQIERMHKGGINGFFLQALGPHHLEAGDFEVTPSVNVTRFDMNERANPGCGWEDDYYRERFGFEI